MTFLDYLPILIIAVIVGGAAFYIYKQKKKGRKCIGCPYCDACASKGTKNACSSKNENKDLQNKE
ncbi:MAG: FeoB-associated Cys-rich membrane protein [Clostridia bacterium]|nr:FeoB-associated Cys-rich membrane protein [Clostridia bacterium]